MGSVLTSITDSFKGMSEWKIYDVTIEKVSLLSNYRSQFNNFLKKNTIQKLLNNLKTKVEEIDKSEK